ncbi:MAG: o-succinylbenzoate synthase [Candidatus Heimdallarchaeota archaeon]|nr:o-succinylbenzoate synthase [Candidatus Heimdallarchaeota archaeon]MCK4953858.1 o-succinylbenzoate synthase [Candidatus Heimdallarchaeota archaeon]
MNVEKATIYLVEMNLRHPFRTSFGVTQKRDILLISLHSEGFVGWGECVSEQGPWYSGETINSSKHIISDYIIPWLKDSQIEDPKQYPKMVNKIKGNQMAKACVEDALWDLYGKMNEKSLKELVNGEKKEIPAGISLGIQDSPEILLDKIKGAIERNYKRVKIKIEPGWDVEIIKLIRDFYPDLQLMVDANSAYRLKDKLIFHSLDRYDLMMIEQPLQYYDIIDHAKLQKEISTPICLDESIKSVDDARVAIEVDACKIINVKPSRIGGITETLKIHDLAKTIKIPLWCGGMLETGIGRAKNVAISSLSTFTLPNDISESSRYYTNFIIDPIFELNKNGTLTVPEKHGLGVEIKEEIIEKYKIMKESI